MFAAGIVIGITSLISRAIYWIGFEYKFWRHGELGGAFLRTDHFLGISILTLPVAIALLWIDSGWKWGIGCLGAWFSLWLVGHVSHYLVLSLAGKNELSYSIERQEMELKETLKRTEESEQDYQE